jgi:hypothetical protein
MACDCWLSACVGSSVKRCRLSGLLELAKQLPRRMQRVIIIDAIPILDRTQLLQEISRLHRILRLRQREDELYSSCCQRENTHREVQPTQLAFYADVQTRARSWLSPWLFVDPYLSRSNHQVQVWSIWCFNVGICACSFYGSPFAEARVRPPSRELSSTTKSKGNSRALATL